MSFFALYADDAHRCALMRIRCASADASAWPTLIPTISNIPTISLLKKRGVTVVIQAVSNKIKIRAWNPLRNSLPASYM